ncbi:MAG: hypothetical protein J5374_02230 [Bacteroidales bacterium]|nr:hypothetical protein [Bacteroidales bacterium]
MKKIIYAILTIALLFPGARMSAQGKYGADSAECIKYLSYYSEYYKQKNYDEALPNWRKAYKLCPPTANQNMLIHGSTLLKQVIAKTKDAEAQRAVVDSLMDLYDVRAEYYPKNKETALNNKGLDMYNYIKDNPQRLYDTYQNIIGELKEATKPSIFLFNLNAAIDLFQAGKLTAEDVINTYQSSMEMLNASTPENEADAEQLEKVKTDVESLFITSKVASCENLIALFTPRFEADPNNLDLVNNIVKMMSITDDCTGNDLYLNAVTNMYKLDPSYNSAYFLYRLNSSRGNVADAIKYLEEAINYPESDASTDGDYNYELAVFCSKNGQNAKAYAAAQKAIDLNPTLSGKAYFLMGTIWGSTNCGGNEIERRAPYWVAVDFLQKAKAADPSLTDDANKLIGSYSAYYPQTAEAFMYDLTNGQSYTVSCGGMRATTTVRTQK